MRRLAAILAMALAACRGTEILIPALDSQAVSAEAATQRALTHQAYYAERSRLLTIWLRLGRANAGLCPETVREAGFEFGSLLDFEPADRPAMAAALRLGEAAQVVALAAGGAADRAGMKIGDVILELDGSQDLARDMLGVGPPARAAEAALGRAEVRLAVRRGGLRRDFTLHTDLICNFPIELVLDGASDVYAEEGHAVVSHGVIRRIQDDRVLAVVLGHELAHLKLQHLRTLRAYALRAYVWGLELDATLGITGVTPLQAFARLGSQILMLGKSRALEAEADYAGLYMTARAGYPIEGVEGIWRRLGVDGPDFIEQSDTHPGSAERYLLLQATRREIDRKRAAGQPLTPNRADGQGLASGAYSTTW